MCEIGTAVGEESSADLDSDIGWVVEVAVHLCATVRLSLRGSSYGGVGCNTVWIECPSVSSFKCDSELGVMWRCLFEA